jgi:hypothetical protein
MLKIRAGSALTNQMRANGSDLIGLIENFDAWKSDTTHPDTFVFGKDGLNRNSDFLRHVHMVPVNDVAAFDKWVFCYENGRQLVSDRYLFYANGGRAYGYLLIALLDDPGGHGIWAPTAANRALLREWEEMADNFFHFGTIP